jgi:hypothetical protein
MALTAITSGANTDAPGKLCGIFSTLVAAVTLLEGSGSVVAVEEA